MSVKHRPRLCVIGLDGASFNVLRPLVDRANLPNFGWLLKNGAHCNLRSTVPWQTPVAWTSMATGVNPGQHGIYGWWTPDMRVGELVPASGSAVSLARFWEVLSSAGIDVGIVNVPMSYPARPIRGFMIAGFDSPFVAPETDELLTYPRDLLENLSDEQDRPYRVVAERVPGESVADATKAWSEVERGRVSKTLELIERYKPDFVQLNLFLTDHLAHRTRPGDIERETAYSVADETIGEFRKRFGDDLNLLVVSDHGSCPISNFVMIHNVLREANLLKFGPWLADEQVRGVLGDEASQADVEELVGRLHREGEPLRSELYETYVDEHPGCNVGFTTIDWNRTKAFCTSDYGQLRINRERGAAAVTDPKESDALDRELSEILLGLSDPASGESLVETVLRRDELYRGRCADRAPDLTPIPTRTDYYFCQVYSFYRNGESRTVAPIREVVDPEQTGCHGDHHADGILLASGSDITVTGKIPDASVLDIAPTALRFFDVPRLPEYEGVMLSDLFGSPRQTKASGVESESATREGLRERLLSLGYRI
jgi:predicted AlkP superfamily phosphohydrolase/phosphomutase